MASLVVKLLSHQKVSNIIMNMFVVVFRINTYVREIAYHCEKQDVNIAWGKLITDYRRTTR